MKRLVAAVIGTVIVFTGCGNSGSGESVSTVTGSTVEASGETAASETSEADSTENVASESTAENFGVSEDEEFSLGEELTPDDNGVISNGFITITMPKEYEGKYLAYGNGTDINIYDRESNEAGFGGFAFGISVTDEFSEYGGMRTKIGELTESDGKLYHILLSYPSDVQWDYVNNKDMPETYGGLYENAREIASSITSADGGSYEDGAGTRGEDIYGDLVKEIADKIENAGSAEELEAGNLSPVYYEVKDPLETMGFCYTDFNLDGVDEMVIGDVETKEIYDVFAAIDGKAAHVISGNPEDYFKVYGSTLAEYTSDSDGGNVIRTHDLLPNSDELFFQYALKSNETEGSGDKWSVSYDGGSSWEALTEEDYRQRLSNIEDFASDKPVEFIRLEEIK